MAATNYTPIQLYFSTTASAVPLAANLAQGELAINITDGKLYYEDNAGAVQVIATKGAGTIGGSTTQIQYNNAGALAGNAAMVFNNSTNVTTLTTLNLTNALGAIYGGTAQSTYAQGDFLYASASNTLSKLGIGTVNYILTSTGTVPQWSAPSSIIVQTATNLAGGLAGSVPYQSALDTTTFLAIGAANRVMTSTGSAPQWVTSLTGLTGVSSSSITNTSLTSGRVVVSTTAGLQADDADLTFDGTTLSAGGYSTAGLTTLVKTVTIGNSSFNGTAVFAAATPAKLYIGTGTVTDTTSAIGATNAVGAISSLAITPIAATNTSVTYTNAATLYIAGAPSAGTNVTLTNPYSLYVAAGAAYFGGAVTVAGSLSLAGVTVTSLTDSGLTSGRVTYAGTGGLLQDSANFTFNGTTVTMANDASINGLTVGRGAGAVASNTAVGASALAANTTGNNNVGLGNQALQLNTTGVNNVMVGSVAGYNLSGTLNVGVGYQAVRNASGNHNVGVGGSALVATTSGNFNTAVGSDALQANTTASNNTAVGYQAGYTNTQQNLTAIGYQALYSNTTGWNTAVGMQALYSNTTGTSNVAFGGNEGNVQAPLYFNTTGSYNTAIGSGALVSNTTASNNTAVGYQAAYTNQTGSEITSVGYQAGYNSTGTNNNFFGYNAGKNVSTGIYNVFIGSRSGSTGATAITGNANTVVGEAAGFSLQGAATYNAFLGFSSGVDVTTGTKNTIIGSYSGNQGGLDIRTASNCLVLSDGDGNPLINSQNGSTVALQGANNQSGTGITFPATQSASTNANTLDDYEEGAWSVLFQAQSTNPTVTYTIREASYTKVGRLVNITIALGATYTGGSGNALFTLPFPVANFDGQNYPIGPVSQYGGGGYTPSIASATVNVRGTANLSHLTFRVDNNTASADEDIGTFSTGGFFFRCTLTYMTT